MRPAFTWLVTAALAFVPVATACNKTVEAAAPNTGASLALPAQVLGLTVQPEKLDVAELKKVDRPYIDSLAVFSLREGKLLRATLQAGRFNRAARPSDSKFRGAITGVVGGSKPVALHIAGKLVDSTSATSQNIYSWFNGRGLFVLSVQQDYPFPRTLLRHLIELDLSL